MDINELIAGNGRFAAAADKGMLRELAEKGQHPVATVITCSDSRVPVEVIFDSLEPGTLFVIRVAGNIVAGTAVLGSIEYAVTHLKTPYLIVLGHTDCGAVKAALAGVTDGETGRLLGRMKLTKTGTDEAVIENLELQVAAVLGMACVKESVAAGVLTVYGMLYDVATGKVACRSKNGAPVAESL